LLKAAANCLDCAAFAILGNVFDLVFGKVDVLERLVEEITQLLLRPARATRRRFSLLRSFRHNFSWARLESACPFDQCCVTLKVPSGNEAAGLRPTPDAPVPSAG
jgi:hypothetical protein